jgi:hypothetical protein
MPVYAFSLMVGFVGVYSRLANVKNSVRLAHFLYALSPYIQGIFNIGPLLF